jgi:hypothetical protein
MLPEGAASIIEPYLCKAKDANMYMNRHLGGYQLIYRGIA